jgi:hypothetical protein
VTPKALKRELNEQFRLLHPWLHPSLKLTKIRKLKQKLLEIAVADVSSYNASSNSIPISNHNVGTNNNNNNNGGTASSGDRSDDCDFEPSSVALAYVLIDKLLLQVCLFASFVAQPHL